jgi:predicted transcriptional regulator
VLNIPLRDLMSKPVITLSPNNSIKDAIRTMQLNNIRRILIMEQEQIKGILTGKDIFKAIINSRALVPDLLVPVVNRQWIKGCYLIGLVNTGFQMFCKRDKNNEDAK